MKKLILPVLLAWMLFIGIDFFFHASLLASYWEQDIAAILPIDQLFRLIPFGYAAFLLQTVLIAYLFNRVFKEKPSINEFIQFTFILAFLFSSANLLALYSYVNIPIKILILQNIVWFIEISAVVVSLHFSIFSTRKRQIILVHILAFIGLIVVGVIIQNT